MQNATMSPKPKRTHKLSQEWKLVARTAPELYEQFYAFVAAMASRAGVKFRGRKLGREATLNAIVIHFFDQEEAEQARILREYVPRYEAILGDEAAAAPGDITRHVDPDSGTPLRKDAGRRKGKMG